MLDSTLVPALAFELILPPLCSLFGALFVLMLGAFTHNKHPKTLGFLSALSLIASLCFLLLLNSYNEETGFFKMITFDSFSFLAQFLMLFSALGFILLSISPKLPQSYKSGEFYALILSCVFGLQILVSSSHLVLILLGLEIASLCSYGLIALGGGRGNLEGAIKYFVFGAFSTGFFIFGVAFLYLDSGSLDLREIFNADSLSLSFAIGFICMLCGVGVKISMFPFHTWTPDAYEGANPLVAGFLSLAPKIGAFILAWSVFSPFLTIEREITPQNSYISAILFVLVVLSMTLPNLLALTQKDVKRMLAYSSITHASFLLAMIFVNTTQAVEGFFLYWFMFVVANIGAFGMLWILRLDSPDCSLARFVGLGKRAPKLACLFALFLLVLIGIPPLSVFWGKMYVMKAAIDSDYVFLALIMALNSAIAAYYYLRVIVAMFLLQDSKILESNSQDFKQEEQTAEFDTSFMPLFVVGICAIFVIISCVLAQKLLSFSEIL
ncbi:NADH-quinone oxidoreductase subunit N [Helicobacter sp. MIT 00-7814]|uniref:NADH-quinone oxidoreductase subunit N n=1 Tax=unclassified Helicobacter TaxID=2593540 RepID=UPI000E1F6275|nr:MULTISPECIES: NADH-quinone oxidoreductase subunit N [unclassified Helicobacter]RDU53919.1 NADH-quinone oxidoreductase subunit N [Helicobacter sp. MIT 00-7814]RDU57049.1 NADH-quinone oxidoreductase subunit N [Helicobacter sp. MIT 99-10781]